MTELESLIVELDDAIRVLAVDDEPDYLELLEDLLTGTAIELRTASDPDAALEALDKGPVDVMLIDLQMPKGGGRRLLSEAKRRYPDVVGVVITAYGSESTAVSMIKDLGAWDYLSKLEVTEERLTESIRAARRAGYASRVATARGAVLVGEPGPPYHLCPVGFLSAQPNLARLPLLGHALDVLRERRERRVLIDLTHLETTTARSLGYLLCAARRFTKAGGRLALAGANRPVAECLRLFDRDDGRGLPVYGSLESARAALAERTE
jgi:DNA-binding response OmpR family regulator